MNSTMTQTVLNYAFAVLFAVISGNIAQVVGEIKDLNSVNARQNEIINDIKISITGSYLTRQEYERRHDQLIQKIDALQSALYTHDEVIRADVKHDDEKVRIK